MTLVEIYQTFQDCRACSLREHARQVVLWDGNTLPKMMLVGEAPGEDEDLQGVPFVGRAGKLLSKALEEAGLRRGIDVYITNTVKCRPVAFKGSRKANRTPTNEEVDFCSSRILDKEVEALRPKVIVTAGAKAAYWALGITSGITKIRGTVHSKGEIKVVPTVHPAYVLRNPAAYRDLVSDIKLAKLLLYGEEG